MGRSKNILWALLGILLLAGGIYFFLPNLFSFKNVSSVACRAEALLCPDGSTVERVGPNCEFAPCESVGTGTVKLTARLDQGVSAFGVQVFPLSILEDSRCPLDAVCIQAGTVRVRALLKSGLGESVMIFELGTPITTEAEAVVLSSVLPEPNSEEPIEPGDYRFVFEIQKR